MAFLASICVLLLFGVMAYNLEWKGRSHQDRMKERGLISSNTSHVNGVPVGYVLTFSFFFTLFVIIVCLINGEL